MNMMKMSGWGCRCVHHVVAYLLVGLMWLAALAFFWAEMRLTLVLGYDSQYYFQAAILLALMAFGTKLCGCCRRHAWKAMGGMPGDKMGGNVCSHEAGCHCGNCSRCC